MSTILKEYRKYIFPFILGVFLIALIANYEGTMQLLSGLWGGIWYILSRIVGGFGVAYILNLFVKALRRRFRFPKWLAIITSYIIFLGVIVWVVLYIIPYIQQSVEKLVETAPGVLVGVQDFLEHNFTLLDEQGLTFINDFFESTSKNLADWASSWINIDIIMPMVSAVGRTLLNMSFWMMISVYALVDKDRVLHAIQRIMRAFMKPDKAEKRIQFCKDANTIFSKYIVGKTIDSLIIGVLSLILYWIFGLEMWPFLAFLAFLFNMIPYFGPLIGGALTVMILLFFSPIQALYALIICVALQTLDGSVIGPRILGDSVGISPLLTIIAIAIGGDIAGLLGIFLSVPVCAIIKILIIDRAVEARLRRAESDHQKRKIMNGMDDHHGA